MDTLVDRFEGALVACAGAPAAERIVTVGLACFDDREALLKRARTEDEALVAGAVALNCRSERFVLSYFLDNLLDLSERRGGGAVAALERLPAWIARLDARALREIDATGHAPALRALAAFGRSPTRLEGGDGALAAALVGSLVGARALRVDVPAAVRRAAARLVQLATERCTTASSNSS